MVQRRGRVGRHGLSQPPEDNGFKFWTPSGQAFGPDLIGTLSQGVENTAELTVPPAEMGSVRRVWDASRRHRDALVDGDCGPLAVVVDLGNGTGQLTVEALPEFGCDVTTINTPRDGTFPGRPSDPTAANCTDLSEMVAEGDADIGHAVEIKKGLLLKAARVNHYPTSETELSDQRRTSAQAP